jgi:hypothetical protein
MPPIQPLDTGPMDRRQSPEELLRNFAAKPESMWEAVLTQEGAWGNVGKAHHKSCREDLRYRLVLHPRQLADAKITNS